ncbi:MAG: hypothetical protein NW223_05950 [Hyphomicrobiaceae bacterium]|nr:hypothetical protein [Hyphomicrobiaceae bacterium]
MRRALILPVVMSAAALALSPGCSGTAGLSLFPSLSGGAEKEQTAGAAAEPRCKTANACAGILKKLVAGKDRSWIGKQLPPEGYSDGTRLFAYRALRKSMTCPEIERAVGETSSVQSRLGGGADASVRNLMSKVNTELRAERLARCRQQAKG